MGFSRARNRNLSPSELDLLPIQSARRCSLETILCDDYTSGKEKWACISAHERLLYEKPGAVHPMQ
jgi:hypothetical protein